MPPLVVVLDVWGVRACRVPAALTRMALDRRALRALPAVRFVKVLGTGTGRTFTPRDADPKHWALLTVWPDEGAAQAYESSATVRAWQRISGERMHVRLRPLASRGRWSGREPFGDLPPSRHDGPVAAITRARLRPALARTFWRAVPPVVADLGTAPGLRLALGIGEAPVGLQGTFSLWASPDALVAFAHRGAAHREAVRRTDELGWYAEDLFARFAVDEVSGTYRGQTP